jgi:hypothetical protein
VGRRLRPRRRHSVDFGQDVYFAAATLVSTSPSGLASQGTAAHLLQVLDAATGLGVLTMVISYLPSLYQAFSRRETTVSQLDARAGSPPSAGRLVVRAAPRGGWPAVNDYPTLAYFRSQHANQNWLAALCTILDATALAVTAAPQGTVEEARFTFAISRHAIADLAYTFRVAPEAVAAHDRLPAADFEALIAELRGSGVELRDEPDVLRERLERFRVLYEPYAVVLSERLELALPSWLAPESPTDNWRTAAWH